VCIRCGARATGTVRRNFYWHEPWIWILILAGLVIYAIVAMVVRKRLDVQVPLCAEHRARRRNLILTAWGIVAGGIAVPIVLGVLDLNVGLGVVVTILAVLTGSILGSAVVNPIRPAEINDGGGTFRGAGAAFLRTLPDQWGPGPMR
jgi:hypothetical protein